MAESKAFTLSILLLGCVLVAHAQAYVSNQNCSFIPASNQSLVDKVYRYFDEDSDVIIVEYVISFNVTSGPFDWSKYSDHESFQPWRWFRTQGSGSSRLLLAFYYYYGLFKDYLTFETKKVKITLTPVPQGCVETVGKGGVEELLLDYLLRDFDINPKAVRHPYTRSDDVTVCSMYIHDVDGWGRLTYRCCEYDDDDDSSRRKECHDVYNDEWVWALRALVITFTIFLFLNLPSLIPGRHQTHTYHYSPTDDVPFNLVMTSHPERFANKRNASTLKSHEWRKMPILKTEVDRLEPEVTYSAHVKRVDCQVNQERIAHKNRSPVSFSQSFFDAFVLCKIRHNSPVEECCHTSVCGELCCKGTCCPPWHSWLRALRVILLMSVIALPALPLFYVITADDLEYQQLDEAHEDRGLLRAFNFYPGKTFSRVIVGVLSFMYVLNTIILVLDGATDGRLTKLYSSVLEISKMNSSLRQKTKTAKVVVKKFFRPLQKYGIYLLPLWLIAIVFLPVALIILYVIDSPMAKILTHAVRKLLERLNVVTRTDLDTDEKLISFCKIFWFLISLIFVFIVITLGINLIVHVIAMIIVEIVVDARIVYQVLPVIFFLLFYIRDSFHRVGDKYKKFLHAVMRTLVSMEEKELQKATHNTWPLETNTMFQVSLGGFKNNFDNETRTSSATSTTSAAMSGPGVSTPLFEVYRGALWIRLQRVVLLMNKQELISTTKKFMFQACDIECFGTPGRLEENFILACLDFVKIAVFLLFVFISVMAYGSVYSISPTNHLFITLVTGLVPLVLRNVFKEKDEDETVDSSSFRFESQLNQKIESFTQSWELRDLFLDSIKSKVDGSDVTNDQPISSTLASSRMANYRQPAKKPTMSTLILDLTEDYTKTPNSKQKHPRVLNRNMAKQRPTRVGNSSDIYYGGESGSGGPGADYVDGGKRTNDEGRLRYENNKYHTLNETERGLSAKESPNNEENQMHYELSNAEKWKRKQKRLASALESSPTAESSRDLDGKHRYNNQNVEKHQSGNTQQGSNTTNDYRMPEHSKLKRQDSSRDFRRFTAPPTSWNEGQGHTARGDSGDGEL